MLATILVWLAALPVFMLANRFCGGGWPRLSDSLPGRAIFWAGPVLGLMTGAVWWGVLGGPGLAVFPAWPFVSEVVPGSAWQLALVVAIGFPLWRAPGWGVRFDLHRQDEDQENEDQENDPRQSDLFVKALDAVSFGSEHVWMFWRLGLLFLPVPVVWCALVGNLPAAPFLAVTFSAIGVLAYELRWRTRWGNALSELLIGALWWAMILIMALMRERTTHDPGFFRGLF